MFKTLYKSYLMNLRIKKSARAIMGLPLPYFGFKNINSLIVMELFPIFLVLNILKNWTHNKRFLLVLCWIQVEIVDCMSMV